LTKLKCGHRAQSALILRSCLYRFRAIFKQASATLQNYKWIRGHQMNRLLMKAALLFLLAGFTAAQAENATASVDWSWSFEPAVVAFPDNDTGISVYATVVNSAQSTESLSVGGIDLSDGSMGLYGLLFDSNGGGVLTATVLPGNLTTQLVAPGESVTGLLFTLSASQPLVVGEEYFVEPYLYVGTNCSGVSSCASWERELPSTPLHITISAVPEPAVNGMLAVGLLAVAMRAGRSQSRRLAHLTGSISNTSRVV